VGAGERTATAKNQFINQKEEFGKGGSEGRRKNERDTEEVNFSYLRKES